MGQDLQHQNHKFSAAEEALRLTRVTARPALSGSFLFKLGLLSGVSCGDSQPSWEVKRETLSPITQDLLSLPYQGRRTCRWWLDGQHPRSQPSPGRVQEQEAVWVAFLTQASCVLLSCRKCPGP